MDAVAKKTLRCLLAVPLIVVGICGVCYSTLLGLGFIAMLGNVSQHTAFQSNLYMFLIFTTWILIGFISFLLFFLPAMCIISDRVLNRVKNHIKKLIVLLVASILIVLVFYYIFAYL